MYLSVTIIERSVAELAEVHSFYLITFLAAKREKLPVGKTVDFPFGRKEKEFLNEYYKPAPASKYFYRVSRIGAQSHHWLPHEFPTSGSQKNRTTTFKDAFEHVGTELWGWKKDYVKVLAARGETP
jgi:hypothetical protein